MEKFVPHSKTAAGNEFAVSANAARIRIGIAGHNILDIHGEDAKELKAFLNALPLIRTLDEGRAFDEDQAAKLKAAQDALAAAHEAGAALPDTQPLETAVK